MAAAGLCGFHAPLLGRRERGGYRGETVSYRLGYIIDDRCNNAESVYLYCIRDTGGQLSACYIPVVEQ